MAPKFVSAVNFSHAIVQIGIKIVFIAYAANTSASEALTRILVSGPIAPITTLFLQSWTFAFGNPEVKYQPKPLDLSDLMAFLRAQPLGFLENKTIPLSQEVSRDQRPKITWIVTMYHILQQGTVNVTNPELTSRPGGLGAPLHGHGEDDWKQAWEIVVLSTEILKASLLSLEDGPPYDSDSAATNGSILLQMMGYPCVPSPPPGGYQPLPQLSAEVAALAPSVNCIKDVIQAVTAEVARSVGMATYELIGTMQWQLSDEAE